MCDRFHIFEKAAEKIIPDPARQGPADFQQKKIRHLNAPDLHKT
jgi:hypothetical protein